MAQWYITLAGVQLGPIGDDQLRRLAKSRRLTADDLVRRQDMSHPIAAGRLNGLFRSKRPCDIAHSPDLLSFSAWYERHPGRWPACIQLLSWFLYGFLWIPAWWGFDLVSSSDDEEQQLGRRVLEIVACLMIAVLTAIVLKECRKDGQEASTSWPAPNAPATSSSFSQSHEGY